MMRVLYVQYTNPGAYPPLVRGAQILAESGAEISMLGVHLPELDALNVTETTRIQVRLMPATSDAWRLKAHYARYAAWVTRVGVQWRPDWIYASDVLSAPIALALAALTGAQVVYHEHDAPSVEHQSWAIRRCLAARARVLRQAAVVVAPNGARAARLSELAGGRSVVTAWNCPRRPTLRPKRTSIGSRLRVIYRGSMNAERFPTAVVEAVARVGDVDVELAGYETAGSRGFTNQLVTLATEFGVRDRIRVLGTIRETELEAVCSGCDVGLALMPIESRDENMRHMAGASNKVFEYFVTGVAPLVTDLPEWRATFVDPGYALACDPRSPGSIGAALTWARDNRVTLRAIADRGWARLQSDWNYETQFAPVVRALCGPGVNADAIVPADAQREAQCVS
jgi:glycosyltransferase involved in cell wall biosynthesis